MTRLRVPIFALFLGGFWAVPLAAQEATLRPVSEYMSQYVSNPTDNDALRYLARRCGVTMLLISDLPGSREQPRLLESYSKAFTTFTHLAIVVEESLGLETAQALAVTEDAMDEIGTALRARLDHNLAVTGSYLADDPMINSDIETCTKLSERMNGGPVSAPTAGREDRVG